MNALFAVWCFLYWPPLRLAHALTKDDTLEAAGMVALCFCAMWSYVFVGIIGLIGLLVLL